MAERLKAWWSDDATPWCGTFAAMCVADAGLTPPKDWYRATAWPTLLVSKFPDPPMAASWYSRGGAAHFASDFQVVGKDKAET